MRITESMSDVDIFRYLSGKMVWIKVLDDNDYEWYIRIKGTVDHPTVSICSPYVYYLSVDAYFIDDYPDAEFYETFCMGSNHYESAEEVIQDFLYCESCHMAFTLRIVRPFEVLTQEEVEESLNRYIGVF